MCLIVISGYSTISTEAAMTMARMISLHLLTCIRKREDIPKENIRKGDHFTDQERRTDPHTKYSSKITTGR